jgi:hypothetical protein
VGPWAIPFLGEGDLRPRHAELHLCSLRAFTGGAKAGETARPIQASEMTSEIHTESKQPILPQVVQITGFPGIADQAGHLYRAEPPTQTSKRRGRETKS